MSKTNQNGKLQKRIFTNGKFLDAYCGPHTYRIISAACNRTVHSNITNVVAIVTQIALRLLSFQEFNEARLGIEPNPT